MTNSLTHLPNSVAPRWATRKPTGPTYGPAIGKTMTLLGMPPMPWQQAAADVIGEVDPATGHLRWPIVVISVQRQSGKSALTLGVMAHRALAAPGRRVWHTAQTGQDARDLWMQLDERLSTSPLSKITVTKRTNGSERIIVNGSSTVRPHPPSREAMHGRQSDLSIIDEAWAFDEEQGAALLQAIQPTQATRPGAQIIILSTRGSAASTWFHDLVDAAKGSDRIALIDYGVDDDVDPDDLDAIAAAHPAIGHTINRDVIDSAAAVLSASEFVRAYGNRATGSIDRIIPAAAWSSALDPDPIADDARVVLAVAASVDRSETSIAVAALDDDGTPRVEVIETRPGSAWAAKRVAAIARKQHAPVMVDAIGPAAAIADALKLDESIEVHTITARELTAGCGDFLDRLTGPDAIDSPRLRIRPNAALDRAVDVVTRKRIGDGWAWSRRGSVGSIASLEASTLAVHGLTHTLEAPAPEMRFG